MVKALAIVGSPRKANTYRLIKTIAELLSKRNIETEAIFLGDINIQNCKGCNNYCSANKTCLIQDDMQSLYSKLKEADVIIIGTPTYFWNVSGSLKTFIDRTHPLYVTRALKGKIGAAVAVSEINGQNFAILGISSFFSLHEIREVGSLSIAHEGKNIKEEDVEMVKTLAEKILQSL
jgi:multimeric flavodoxin WrbA